MTLLFSWFRRRRNEDRLADLSERDVLTPDDRNWMHAEAARNPGVADELEAARRWVQVVRSAPDVQAPADFTETVLRRARAEAQVRAEDHWHEAPRPRLRWAAAVAFLVVAGVLFALPDRPETEDIKRAGPAAYGEAPVDLVVQAPLLGAVEGREAFEAAVSKHHGQVERFERSVVARVPRAELVAVLSDLAKVGPFQVDRLTEPTELDEKQMVTVRFDLED